MITRLQKGIHVLYLQDQVHRALKNIDLHILSALFLIFVSSPNPSSFIPTTHSSNYDYMLLSIGLSLTSSWFFEIPNLCYVCDHVFRTVQGKLSSGFDNVLLLLLTYLAVLHNINHSHILVVEVVK